MTIKRWTIGYLIPLSAVNVKSRAHTYQVSSKLYRLVRKNAEGDGDGWPLFRFPLCLPPSAQRECDKMDLALILARLFVTLCYSIPNLYNEITLTGYGAEWTKSCSLSTDPFRTTLRTVILIYTNHYTMKMLLKISSMTNYMTSLSDAIWILRRKLRSVGSRM